MPKSPLQSANEPVHAYWQLPVLHIAVAFAGEAHALSQRPQWLTLVRTSTQLPEHCISPVSQPDPQA
jgi:hypothetical protein